MQTVIQFISLLISGVSLSFQFFLTLPSIIIACLGMIPNYLSGVLSLCLGIIIGVRVLELLP